MLMGWLGGGALLGVPESPQVWGEGVCSKDPQPGMVSPRWVSSLVISCLLVAQAEWPEMGLGFRFDGV